jgi:hypothetical protein
VECQYLRKYAGIYFSVWLKWAGCRTSTRGDLLLSCLRSLFYWPIRSIVILTTGTMSCKNLGKCSTCSTMLARVHFNVDQRSVWTRPSTPTEGGGSPSRCSCRWSLRGTASCSRALGTASTLTSTARIFTRAGLHTNRRSTTSKVILALVYCTFCSGVDPKLIFFFRILIRIRL